MTNRDFNDILNCLALLCDAMKRLEKSVEQESIMQRNDYLMECKERRERVEHKILAMTKPIVRRS